MSAATAFVLAGGQSTRMGTEKAFVELEGQALLSRMLAIASAVAPEVRILGSKSKFDAYGVVVEDEFPNHGPLGGIHAALRSSTTDLNLILAVDIPLLEIRFLQYLIAQAGKDASAVVTVPRAQKNWQPLCAVYRKPFLQVAENALREGKNKIDPLFASVHMHVIEEDEIVKQGFSPNMFHNVNTQEELKELKNANVESLRTDNRELRTSN